MDTTEHVLPLADPRMLAAPFCYLAGHKLVEFNAAERRNFEACVRNGGFLLVDDCTHAIDGLFAKSFEREMATIVGEEVCRSGESPSDTCMRQRLLAQPPRSAPLDDSPALDRPM